MRFSFSHSLPRSGAKTTQKISLAGNKTTTPAIAGLAIIRYCAVLYHHPHLLSSDWSLTFQFKKCTLCFIGTIFDCVHTYTRAPGNLDPSQTIHHNIKYRKSHKR
jgi:hypothetical protein